MSTDFAQLLEQLQQSGSPRERSPAWRRVLCQAVNQTLTDTDKVVKDLTQKFKNSSPKEQYPEYDMALQFVTHCITVCSQCFVIGPASSGDDTPSLSQVRSYMESDEESQCYATTCWLITRLLRILAHPKCQPIHGETLGVMLVLVRTVKMKDPYMFARLLSEFIMCLKDLTCTSEDFYKEGGTEYSVEVHQFHVVNASQPSTSGRSSLGSGEAAEVTLTHKPITLKDPASCESLQTAISKLLASLGMDVCRCASCQLHDVLWGTLCCQLEYGELELKKASLALSQKLLVWGGLPTEEVVDYYLNCLIALVHLIASGTREIQGDYIGLETSLGSSLDAVSQYLNKSHQTRTIGADQIQTQLLELSRSVTEHGMAQVQTAVLKQAISALLVRLQVALPSAEVTSGILGGQMEQLTRAMVAELGTSEDAQHWVRCLHQAAMLDMVKLQAGSGHASDTDSVTPHSSGAPPENLSSEESEKEGRPKKKKVPTATLR